MVWNSQDRYYFSLAAMRTAAVAWSREVAGQRIHGTTGEQPFVAFADREQPRLLPLPPAPWEPATWTTAKVQPDCHLTVGGAHYSVPHRYVGQRLEVRLGRATVQIYDGAALVTAHERRTHGRATRLEHYPDAGQAFLRATPRACVEQAQLIGPATATLVRGLLITERLHHLREAQAVLRLVPQYPPERVERACQLALEAGDGRLRTVRGLLEREVEQLEPAPVDVGRPASAFLRGPAAFRTTSTATGMGREVSA